MRTRGVVITDNGSQRSDRLKELVASLNAHCSDLVRNLEQSRIRLRKICDAAHELNKPDLRADEFRRRFHSLTTRQKDVLERIFRGDSNKVIAFDLEVSQKTVETHRARLMRKLQAASFADLIRCYIMAFGSSGHMPQIRRASKRVSPRLAKAVGDRD